MYAANVITYLSPFTGKVRGNQIAMYCSHFGIDCIGHSIPEIRRNGKTTAIDSCSAEDSSVAPGKKIQTNEPLAWVRVRVVDCTENIGANADI